MKNLTLTVFFVIVAMLGISGVSHSQMVGQPANSYVSGANWFCNSGFKKSGNECVSIFASMAGQPVNSYVSGVNWFCNSGFKKSGNECVSIFASMAGQPANSYVSGASWFCNSGFKKAGNECVSIFSGKSVGSGSTSIANPPITTSPSCAENGSCYGDVSTNTGKPKTVSVKGYYRKDGTYVRGHYRSK